ncbi:MAG: hypothetical protein AAB074_20015 [Planctomycetota bacterium]
MIRPTACAAFLVVALAALSEEPAPVPSPPHKDGAWLEVPDFKGRLEIVMSKDKKSATVYSLDQDGKTPVGLKTAPELKIPALDEAATLRGRALNLKEGTASDFEFRVPPAGDGDLAKDPPARLGPHGGEWVDVSGPKGIYFEYVYNAKLGRVSIWFYGEDGKTPLLLADSPVFNVDTPLDGMVSLPGKAVALQDGTASRFDYEGADLAARPPGGGSRFSIQYGGKPYQAPIINREHGHMHGPGGVAAPK